MTDNRFATKSPILLVAALFEDKTLQRHSELRAVLGQPGTPVGVGMTACILCMLDMIIKDDKQRRAYDLGKIIEAIQEMAVIMELTDADEPTNRQEDLPSEADRTVVSRDEPAGNSEDT